MVQVFYWNCRFIHYKCTYSTALILLFFILTFEIRYHFLNTCAQDEPIDVVYTWVNGSDPKFLTELESYLRKSKGGQIDWSKKRFDDKNELKFSLRSLEKYAPWIGHVYIVTNGQIPHWLNLDYEKVTLVTHREIFTDEFNVPTFSSHAIETQIHRIPNLSKRFIYFNDDVFLRSPVHKEDFFSERRGFLIYLSYYFPKCAPKCSWANVANGHCDHACNNLKCQMDGGDCGDVIIKVSDLQNTTQTRFFRKLHQNMPEIIAELKKKLDVKNVSQKNAKKIKNRNVDAYTEAVQHTNRMLNDYYGFSVRKEPAHAPIMIDKDVMENLQKKFAKFFEKTARNRVRSVDDIQFAFAYYYFVIHEKTELSVDEIFDRFDTDFSGIWSDTEIRTVVTKLYDLPITDNVYALFTNMLINCSRHSILSTLLINKDFVKHCPPLSTFLKLKLGFRHKYKFELVKESEGSYVYFIMVFSNAKNVLKQLDGIRKHPRKFVCLNDDLDRRRNLDNQIIERQILDFYVSLFPVPSKFELPENYRNRFLYMEDYLRVKNQQRRRVVLGWVFLTVTIFLLLWICSRRRVCALIQKCFC